MQNFKKIALIMNGPWNINRVDTPSLDMFRIVIAGYGGNIKHIKIKIPDIIIQEALEVTPSCIRFIKSYSKTSLELNIYETLKCSNSIKRKLFK